MTYQAVYFLYFKLYNVMHISHKTYNCVMGSNDRGSPRGLFCLLNRWPNIDLS